MFYRIAGSINSEFQKLAHLPASKGYAMIAASQRQEALTHESDSRMAHAQLKQSTQANNGITKDGGVVTYLLGRCRDTMKYLRPAISRSPMMSSLRIASTTFVCELREAFL